MKLTNKKNGLTNCLALCKDCEWQYTCPHDPARDENYQYEMIEQSEFLKEQEERQNELENFFARIMEEKQK